jgi:hypothetical protein
MTPLELLADHDVVEEVMTLLQQYPDLRTDKNGLDAWLEKLAKLSIHFNPEKFIVYIRQILDYGADPNIRVQSGVHQIKLINLNLHPMIKFLLLTSYLLDKTPEHGLEMIRECRVTLYKLHTKYQI